MEVISTVRRNYADIPIGTKNIDIKDILIADQSEIIILIDEYDAPIINNFTNPHKISKGERNAPRFL
jgi:hypothetical protein